MASVYDRFLKQRLSRRRLLAGAGGAAMGTAGLVLLGCGDGGGNGGNGGNGGVTPIAGTPTVASAPRSGGTLTFGSTVSTVFGVDPQTEIALGLLIFPRVYGYLIHQNPRDDTVFFDQAANLETPTESEYIFTIRDDVRYQAVTFPDQPDVGARNVEARDVVATIRRLLANPLVSLPKTLFTEILEEPEARDPRTVYMQTRMPYVYTFEGLGSIFSVIIPEELTDLNVVENLNFGGVGSGPYIVESVNGQEEIRIRKNPDYFRKPVPYVDNMVFRVIPDTGTIEANFRSQAIDAFSPSDALQAERVAQFTSGGHEAIVTESPNLAYVSFGMDVTQPPFNDIKAREAISLAIDREELIEKITFGTGAILGPVNQHLRDGFWALPEDELRRAYGMDLPKEERLQKARDLMIEAGVEGANIELKYPQLTNISAAAVLVQQQLQAVGFQVSLVGESLILWFIQTLRQGNFHATLHAHLPYETPNIPTRYFHSKGVPSTESWHHYANPDVDALIERHWGEFDENVRRATLLELQRLILAEHGPMLNLYTGKNRAAYWSYLKDWKRELPGSMQQYVYDNWLDT